MLQLIYQEEGIRMVDSTSGIMECEELLVCDRVCGLHAQGVSMAVTMRAPWSSLFPPFELRRTLHLDHSALSLLSSNSTRTQEKAHLLPIRKPCYAIVELVFFLREPELDDQEGRIFRSLKYEILANNMKHYCRSGNKIYHNGANKTLKQEAGEGAKRS